MSSRLGGSTAGENASIQRPAVPDRQAVRVVKQPLDAMELKRIGCRLKGC